MTKQEISNYLAKLTNSLEQRRLKETFDTLTFLLSHLQNWQLKEELNNLEDTYKMMLRYLIDGVNDPEREKVYDGLLRSLYHVADRAELQMCTAIDSSYFYEKRRSHHYYYPESETQLITAWTDLNAQMDLVSLLEEAENPQLIQLQKQKEELIRKIFYSIWLSSHWSAQNKQNWMGVINASWESEELSAMIVAAITLSLMQTFDEQKALLLFDAAENESEEIKQRALTGILLFLRKYDKRLPIYTSITSRLHHLEEDSSFIRNIRHIILQFILSRETERITRKIKDELLPEMMKISPKLSNKIKMDDLLSDSGIEDRNPEWQELLKEAGLEGKLQEISELQMEGADVMHSSFIHLKNYSFFNELSNWFLPFIPPAEASKEDDLKTLVDVLVKSTLLCNSDKYSFYLSIAQMPESYRKMTTAQFSMENSAMQEMKKEEAINDSKKISPIARQYIQDLYRFYKLYPRKKDFEDIFEIKPEFYKIPSIASLVGNDENLLIIGEYYFSKNYFEEAADIYHQLIKTDPNNDVLYQKEGYCLQMQGDSQKALDLYLKAELFSGDNLWLIKKIAYCYRVLKQPGEALVYYKKAEQLTPDNLSLQLNIGHCYLELKNYDEALKCYFKVEYLDKNRQKAWRPIAWCSFLTGKYNQAKDYFDKIMTNNPGAIDFLNAGHTQWAMGEVKEAIRLYALSLKSPDNSIEGFRESLMNDMPDLINAGVKKEDVPFVLDCLMYDL